MRFPFFRPSSLAAQFVVLTSVCLVLVSGAALVIVAHHIATAIPNNQSNVLLRLELIAALACAGLASLALTVSAIRTLLTPLHQLQHSISQVIAGDLNLDESKTMPNRELQLLHETFARLVHKLREAKTGQDVAQKSSAAQTRSLLSVLEFSQTVQGAGQSEQIYGALGQILKQELNLAGVAVLLHKPDALPPIQIKCTEPKSLLAEDKPAAEMDASLCPCLRQNVPRQFRPEGSPIRCAIDSCMTLGKEHPAYCIPLTVSRNLQGVVHMLLAPNEEWTNERRHLAETYVNTARSSLISLHLVETAEMQSLTDPLTGLYNRHSMEKLLQREVALAERHSHPLSVVMVDIDFFKKINDTHGHAAGDHILKAFADCVRMTLRKTDLAFRFGGDEFMITLPQTAVPQARQVVSKLRQAFAAVDFSHAITNLDNQPTLSVGVVERDAAANTLTLESLLSAADQALYEAKSADRNCVKVYEPPTKAA